MLTVLRPANINFLLEGSLWQELDVKLFDTSFLVCSSQIRIGMKNSSKELQF